jgi:hypothetical protein
MDFVGTGQKLTNDDIARAARRLGCDPAMVRAVLRVEARGSGWDNRNRPAVLFEPHVFWRCLPEPLRPRAQAVGLAWPTWRPGKYPERSDDRYAQIERAMAIHETAALKAVSWGIGQVLGENHAQAGHLTPQAMVTACKEGEGAQLDCMIGYMIANGLALAMQKPDFAWVARVYNGPSFARHGYDQRIEKAYRQILAEERPEYDPLTDGLLMKGDKGDAVRALQIELQAEGFRVVADGDFGPVTEQAVKAYQRAHGLRQDGKVGAQTGRALGLTLWG